MSSSAGSSPLSSLSSVPSDEEMPVPPLSLNGAPVVADSDHSSSEMDEDTTKGGREASPPHEDVLADNPDIAFIVMFRTRFSDAFPAKLIQLGPQDIERGVVDSTPSREVEQLLCALLGLALNRKKPVESGHYGRALEEAIQTHKGQWPRAWNGVNPLHGGRSFNVMTPTEKLSLLRALVMWSLQDSDAINAIIKDSYKQSRQDGDLNQPLSVQPWGRDGLKRRYWLIEGRDDTPFRLYRENNPALKNGTWWSMAGSIDELRVIVEKLEKESTQHAKRLAQRITNSIPRFEATEEKRKRREYRLARKAAWAQPEPGYSRYEGRTRGKRMRYNYDEDLDDEMSDALDIRRSTRNSGVATPAETGPTVTLSGRQVRSRFGTTYGSTLPDGQTARSSPGTDPEELVRASRSGQAGHSRRRVEEEGDTSSEGEWDGGDEDEADEPDEVMGDAEEEESDASEGASESEDDEPQSLVVTLRYNKERSVSAQHRQQAGGTSTPTLPVPAANGYPTPSPASVNSVNGTNGPTPLAISSATTKTEPALPTPQTAPKENLMPAVANGLPPNPYADAAPKKQSQLPFQPVPQKPATLQP